MAVYSPEYVDDVRVRKRSFVDAFGGVDAKNDGGVVDGRQAFGFEGFGQSSLEYRHLVDGDEQRLGVNVDVIAPASQIFIICRILKRNIISSLVILKIKDEGS